jgi:hypothetical protein
MDSDYVFSSSFYAAIPFWVVALSTIPVYSVLPGFSGSASEVNYVIIWNLVLNTIHLRMNRMFKCWNIIYYASI